jgi:L-talarate/galactarate dehydratase
VKITAVDVIPVQIPMDFTYGEIKALPAVVAKLHTDEGLEGLGHAITLQPRNFRSLTAATEELSELLVGEDPRAPERLWRKMVPDGQGAGGVGNGAAAVLDVGVWDLAAKAAGLPLYRLLGGYRSRIPAYASLRLGRDLPTGKLPGVATSLVAQGFRAMKTNLGGPWTLETDLDRVRSVREAIGPEISLMADVNFRWTPSVAIQAGRRLEEFQLFWLEDPVPTQNLQGLADVRRALDMSVMAGEALYGLPAFRNLFEARAVDLAMPDLVRVAGITPFLKIAHLAESFGVPIACHLLPEISCQVVAAVPNGQIVEYVPWAWKLFHGCPELDQGDLVLSERPGTGLELDEDFVKQHRVS